MNSAWVLIGLWVVLAFVIAAFPSKDNHWRVSYGLTAIGVPIALWIFWQHGVWMGLVAVAAGVSVLRWPVYYLWQRIKRLTKGG